MGGFFERSNVWDAYGQAMMPFRLGGMFPYGRRLTISKSWLVYSFLARSLTVFLALFMYKWMLVNCGTRICVVAKVQILAWVSLNAYFIFRGLAFGDRLRKLLERFESLDRFMLRNGFPYTYNNFEVLFDSIRIQVVQLILCAVEVWFQENYR
jgi:hypothetical protein